MNRTMNRTEYRRMRRLVRANGAYALRYPPVALTPEDVGRLHRLFILPPPLDRLADRADIVAWCKREGISCNPRQTA